MNFQTKCRLSKDTLLVSWFCSRGSFPLLVLFRQPWQTRELTMVGFVHIFVTLMLSELISMDLSIWWFTPRSLPECIKFLRKCINFHYLGLPVIIMAFCYILIFMKVNLKIIQVLKKININTIVYIHSSSP